MRLSCVSGPSIPAPGRPFRSGCAGEAPGCPGTLGSSHVDLLPPCLLSLCCPRSPPESKPAPKCVSQGLLGREPFVWCEDFFRMRPPHTPGWLPRPVTPAEPRGSQTRASSLLVGVAQHRHSCALVPLPPGPGPGKSLSKTLPHPSSFSL